MFIMYWIERRLFGTIRSCVCVMSQNPDWLKMCLAAAYQYGIYIFCHLVNKARSNEPYQTQSSITLLCYVITLYTKSALHVTTQLFFFFTGFFLSVIITMAISGNILVCVAVLTDRNLRKIGNLYIVSLSFADMTLACLVMTFALANDLLGYWPFGKPYCDTWVAFDVMCSTASILNLCAISLDRYIHIKDPLRYGRWMTKRVVLVSIIGLWMLAVLVSFLPISLDLHRPKNSVKNDFNEKSSLPQCALDLTPLYAVVSSCISFYVPCIVMIAIYSRLYFYAKKHVESIKALSKPVTFGTIDGIAPPPVQNQCHVSETKAATTVGVIVGVFLVCYVPFFCINIVASFCKTCIPNQVFQTLTWFGYSNSSFNPIIYSIFNAEFREAFRRILRRVRQCLTRSFCPGSTKVTRHKSKTSLTHNGRLTFDRGRHRNSSVCSADSHPSVSVPLNVECVTAI